jgi:hypothetical protein
MKKLILICAFICASQLYGMEQAGYMADLPKDVQLLIIQDLISGNDLDAILNGITRANKTTLNKTINEMYGNPAGFRDLVQILAKRFPKVPTEWIAWKISWRQLGKEKGKREPRDLMHVAQNYTDKSSELLTHIFKGNIDQIENDIKNGADINFSESSPFPGDEGLTPLLQALHYARSKSVIQLLLQYGANPNAKFGNGKGVFDSIDKYYENVQEAQEIKQLLKEEMDKS